jgi:hypothetical protein
MRVDGYPEALAMLAIFFPPKKKCGENCSAYEEQSSQCEDKSHGPPPDHLYTARQMLTKG